VAINFLSNTSYGVRNGETLTPAPANPCTARSSP
jgi:hypothetical protein